MKFRSEVVGWVITFIYLLVVGMLVYLKRSTLDTLGLNEIGDFLAGVFGPVAFLWLVLGYLQQGRELKLSSEALRAQADELRESVQQQSALVKAQNASLQNHERSLEPLLQLVYKGTSISGGKIVDKFFLVNRGNYCEQVFARVLVAGVESRTIVLGSLSKEGTIGFDLLDCVLEDVQCEVCINYQKVSGQLNFQSFVLVKTCSGGIEDVVVFKNPFYGEAPNSVGAVDHQAT